MHPNRPHASPFTSWPVSFLLVHTSFSFCSLSDCCFQNGYFGASKLSIFCVSVICFEKSVVWAFTLSFSFLPSFLSVTFIFVAASFLWCSLEKNGRRSCRKGPCRLRRCVGADGSAAASPQQNAAGSAKPAAVPNGGPICCPCRHTAALVCAHVSNCCFRGRSRAPGTRRHFARFHAQLYSCAVVRINKRSR